MSERQLVIEEHQDLINEIATHIRKLEDSLAIAANTAHSSKTAIATQRAIRLANHEVACLHKCLGKALEIAGTSLSENPAVVYSGGQPKPDNPPKGDN